MQHVISVKNMRVCDKRTIESGVPSLELMYRAAKGIRESSDFEGKTLIAVGSGNNGGDGFALALLLLMEGRDVAVISVTDHYSQDSSYYMNKALGMGLKLIDFVKGKGLFKGYDTIVDCLLGTGFSGKVEGSYADAINEINDAGLGTCAGPGSYIISADINSGMNGDSGEADLAVKSDLTVVIGFHKTGILKARKSGLIRKICCVDIGISLTEEENYLLTREEWTLRSLPEDKDEIELNGRICFRED